MLRLNDIKQAALDVGFDDCGVAHADALTDDEYPLREWLLRGWHGNLAYMERNVDKRMDPRLLLPGAKSVICCVSAYPPPNDDLPASGGNPENLGNRFDKISQDFSGPDKSWKSQNNLHDFAKREKVAAYARTREYHKVIKDMLFALRERLGIDGKCCCDTVPISDKHWAARAGLGWIGRHTLLITPRWGTWVNLGEIVTTEEVLPAPGGNPGNLGNRFDKISQDFDGPNKSWKSQENLQYFHDFAKREKFCSKCGKCVAACPNQALAPDGPPMLNVTRCTAYYTTHHQRELPPDIVTQGYTQGCDLCQLACPFNRSLPSPFPK